VLWCGDDHHRHLDARATDPGATSATSRRMSADTCRCSNHPSALQHREPVADGFALRCDNVVSCPTYHRKLWRINSGTGHLSDVTARLIGLITTLSPTVALQIPIAL
jgi:hypothetical protein